MAENTEKGGGPGTSKARRSKILIIDDERPFTERISNYLGDRFDLCSAMSGREGLEKVGEYLPDVVLLDFKLGGDYSGLDVLREIKSNYGYINVILVSNYLNEEVVAAAENLGVDECIPKNLKLGVFDRLILRAIERNLVARKSQLVERSREEDEIVPVFDSPVMRGVRAKAEGYRDLGENILITGPTGSGKEVLAHWIHFTSKRAGTPFCIVDLAGFSLSLLEAELFGLDEHAVADAQPTKRGLLELAHGGTIVLDEIGSLPAAAQTKLLRVVEKKKFHRLGSDRMIGVDVRLIILTGRDLPAMIREGIFTSELYYRINTLRIEIPRLCERPDDIPRLAKHMLQTFSRKFRKGVREIEPAVERRFLEYSWPGNVRELECVMKSAIMRATGPNLSIDDVAPSLGGPLNVEWNQAGSAELRLKEARKAWERNYCLQLLKIANGDVKAAAALAALPRESLYRLLRQLKISPEEFRQR
jgi:DNA-binding NtrC family response regulator